MTHDNKLQVEAIKRGTVIDHIPAQIGFKLLSLFKLTETDQRITIGLKVPYGEMGRKHLIKIGDEPLVRQMHMTIKEFHIFLPANQPRIL